MTGGKMVLCIHSDLNDLILEWAWTSAATGGVSASLRDRSVII